MEKIVERQELIELLDSSKQELEIISDDIRYYKSNIFRRIIRRYELKILLARKQELKNEITNLRNTKWYDKEITDLYIQKENIIDSLTDNNYQYKIIR